MSAFTFRAPQPADSSEQQQQQHRGLSSWFQSSQPQPASASDASSSTSDDLDEAYWEERERELMRKEFDESMQQLKVLLEMIVLPYAGKFLGRKLAFWAWSRYVDLGVWGFARSLVPFKGVLLRT